MYQVGIDVGGTNIKIGLIDTELQIIRKTSIPFPRLNGEEVAIILTRAVRGLLDECGLTEEQVHHIGVVVPGSIDPTGGVIIDAHNLGFHQVPFRELLQKQFASTPIYLANDADGAALAELGCGAVERLEGDAEQAERSAHVLDAAQREGLGEGDCPQRKGNFDIVDENVQQRVSNPGNIQDHQRLDAAVFKLVADSDSVGRIPDNTGSFDDLNALCFHRLLCCCKQLAGSLAAAFVMTCNTDKSCNNLFHGKVSLLCFLF